MKLTSISIENFLGVTKKVTLNLDEGLTTVVGSAGINLNAIVDGLSIFFGYRWPRPDEFFSSGELNNSLVMTFTARFTDVPETVSPDRHTFFRPGSEYLLQENGDFVISRSFRMTREGLQERVYANAIHPSEPGLNDLLQVNNTILKRRLTSSTVSACAVDRRCNSAIRHALWEHSADLSLRPEEVSLCRGDALLIWQALQMHFPLVRVVREVKSGSSAPETPPLRSPHDELTRVAPRHYAGRRAQDLSMVEPMEMYDLPPSQQWMMVPQQIINKTEPPVTIPADTFLREGARAGLGPHGISHLYCILAPAKFDDEATRSRWLSRIDALTSQPGNRVLLAVSMPTPLNGLPTHSVCVLSRGDDGDVECIDERPLAQKTGIPGIGIVRNLRAGS